MYINQLLHILSCFLKTLGGVASQSTEPTHQSRADTEVKGHRSLEPSTKLLRLNDFLLASSTDHINFFKV